MNKSEALNYLKTINDAKINNMRNLERRYQESGLTPFSQEDVSTNNEIRFTDEALGDDDKMYRDEARTNLIKILGKKNEERVIEITDTNILNDTQIKELALYWEDYEQPLRKFEGKLVEFNRFKSILQDLLNAGIRKRQPIQQPVVLDGRTEQQQIPETPEVKQGDIYKKSDGDQTVIKDFGKNPMFVDDEEEDMPELEDISNAKGPESKGVQLKKFKMIKDIKELLFPNGNPLTKDTNTYALFGEIIAKCIEIGMEGLNKKKVSWMDLKSSIENLENQDINIVEKAHQYFISTPFKVDPRTNHIESYSLANFNRLDKIQDIANVYDPDKRVEWNNFISKEINTDNTGIAKTGYNLKNKFNSYTNDEIVILYNQFVGVPVVGKGMKPHMKVIGSKYYVDSRKVGKGILEVRYLKNRHLTNLKTQNISDDMKPIVNSIMDKTSFDKSLYNKLNAKEKNLVSHLSKMAQNDEEFDDDEFTKEFQIIIGQIEAGNNSELLKQKLRSYIFYGVKIGKISRQQAYDLMIEFGL